MRKKILAVLLCVVIASMLLEGCAVVKAVETGITNISYDFADQYTIGGGSTDKKISKIEVNWVAGDINLTSDDSDKISFNETGDKTISEDMKMRYLIVDDVLRIQFSKAGQINLNTVKKELNISLPKGYNLDEISIDVVSSRVKMDGVTAKKLDYNTVSGSASITNAKMETVKMATVSGELDFSGSITKELRTEAVSGAVRLTLPDCKGFKVKMDTVSGSFKSDYETSGDKRSYSYGDESLYIQCDSVSGSVRILK